jgi:hypothetical protein
MKITESYLRKIIRGTLAEMMGGADGVTAMGTIYDNPGMEEEELSGSPSDIVEDILSTYKVGGRIDSGLVSKLMKLQAQLDDAPVEPSGMSFGGLGENKKRRLN